MVLKNAVLTSTGSFKVAGIHIRTRNKDESNLETAKIQAFWQKFHAMYPSSKNPVFGVYSQYENRYRLRRV